jgi:hypothetical protein
VPGRAGANPVPRGAGPKAGDGSVAQNCSAQSNNPAGACGCPIHRLRRGSCFPKHPTGISFPACPWSHNATTPRRVFGAGAFLIPIGVFRWDTQFCLHARVSYPRAAARFTDGRGAA